MSGTRNEGRFAVGNGLGEISAHGGRNTWVLFALPEVHPDFDILQRKAPWSPVVDHELVRRASSSLPQGFGKPTERYCRISRRSTMALSTSTIL